MTGSGGGNSMASTGSFLPTGENSAKMHHGKQHYGLPVHGAGLSFHEKTLLGLMGWWMAMNFIGIIYALMAVDFRGDGMFQKETPAGLLEKASAAFVRIISLGVWGTRPRPQYDPKANPPAEGGGKQSGTSILKFLVALLGFLFLGVLFPSNIKKTTESFFDLGDLPDFFGKSKNKPGDILGNASNISSKLTSDTANTSTLSKNHATMLESIQSRITKFKQGSKKWENEFNTETKDEYNTYYWPKEERWKGWRIDE